VVTEAAVRTSEDLFVSESSAEHANKVPEHGHARKAATPYGQPENQRT
jgi:hypothetical protein